MPKLKFLNANGDFVLTDADQAAETYFPLANEYIEIFRID